MSEIEALRDAVQRLEAAYTRREQQLREQIPTVEPLDVVDPHGRPILLDALVAIVNARVALAASGGRPSTGV